MRFGEICAREWGLWEGVGVRVVGRKGVAFTTGIIVGTEKRGLGGIEKRSRRVREALTPALTPREREEEEMGSGKMGV